MLRVFLVDDERAVRENLRDTVPWNQWGFEVAGEAGDGEMALALIRKTRPDVLITDIRMPFVDGIELLKTINERGLCRCVLLLSEFAEFNYAKEGILNGAFDYILKPVDEIKIREALTGSMRF